MTESQLADWESATMRTLAPYVTKNEETQLWDAIIANRANPNRSYFYLSVCSEITDGSREFYGALIETSKSLGALLEAKPEVPPTQPTPTA